MSTENSKATVNSNAAVYSKPVSYEQLAGIFACLGLALLAHLGSLPAWVFVTVAVSGGIRLARARGGRPAPPRGVRLAVAGLTIALLFLQFRTFNGLSAGTALLGLVAGLKLLETETQRDIYVITLSIYFLSVAALLQSTSFWLFAFLTGVCWLTTATLLRLTSTLPVPDWRSSLRYAGRILAQALPLTLALWLFFPRFAGPLWQIPVDSHVAGSGLSDSMSPGDIDQLAMSDEVAFRVHFAAATPPPQERYWRGPVLHDFNGHTWTRSYSMPRGAAPLLPMGPAYEYTVSLEPHQHRWLFALDYPSRWNLPDAALTSDYTLVQRDPVSRPLDVTATSYTKVQAPEPLSKAVRRLDAQTLPKQYPRTMQLAQTLRSAHPDDADYVRAVLTLFNQQPFYYTLTPPKLADDSVDGFLFDTKRGFCEHYASAFAILMRAAGIPAHVVTGYQGGSFNRFADYWIVRQSDAHAWDEVWIEGHGWLRVDPTSAIAPARIEGGGDALSAGSPLAGRWQYRIRWFADARLRLDALEQIWRERILFFDQGSQQKLLEWLNIPEPDGQKLVLLLTAALILVLIWLTWSVRREADPAPKDVLIRAYSRLCAKLAAAGIPRRSYEGAEDYAGRVARDRPDLGPAVSALCRQYSILRYAAGPAHTTVTQFVAAVRTFHPAQAPSRRPDSPASSRS
jgi:transglutaminase-like putative cysteine protease